MCHLQVFTIILMIIILIIKKIMTITVLIMMIMTREDDRSGKEAMVNYGLWQQGQGAQPIEEQ